MPRFMGLFGLERVPRVIRSSCSSSSGKATTAHVPEGHVHVSTRAFVSETPEVFCPMELLRLERVPLRVIESQCCPGHRCPYPQGPHPRVHLGTPRSFPSFPASIPCAWSVPWGCCDPRAGLVFQPGWTLPQTHQSESCRCTTPRLYHTEIPLGLTLPFLQELWGSREEEAAHLPRSGLWEGVREDLAPAGTPEVAHGGETLHLHLGAVWETLHPLRRTAAAQAHAHR